MLNSLSLSLFQFVFFPFMSSSFCEKHKKTTFLNLVLSFDSVWYFLWTMIHLIVFRFHNNSFLMKISHKWLSYSFSLFHVCIVSRRMERRSHGMQEQMKTKNVKRKKKNKIRKNKNSNCHSESVRFKNSSIHRRKWMKMLFTAVSCSHKY